MRDKDALFGLENVCILNQYLYMNEENYVIVNNGVAKLRIRMDEELNYWCKNLNFPDVREMLYNETMYLENCLSIIEQLKKQPAFELPNNFDNRWEEIKTLTKSNLALNSR